VKRLALLALLALAACRARPVPVQPPLPEPEQAAPGDYPLERVPPESWPTFRDDGGFQFLAEAAEHSLAYYRAQPPEKLFAFGPDRFTTAHMIDSMETFIALLRNSPETFPTLLREQFWLYRSTGADRENTVTFSAYYEHTLEGSLAPGNGYDFPIYRKPPDLEEVASGEEKTVGRTVDGKRVPYHSRKDIDSGGALKGKGLEIAWAKDPVEVYFLQVQGSGWLRLPTGRMVRIRYAANNGLPYRSVGTTMIARGLVARDKFNRATMTAYLAAHPEQRQDILNENPRYVFFELDTSPTAKNVYGGIRVPLTADRSIATDPRLFPRGALAWMETFAAKSVQRFVLNQDEGGAIKGPARVDYFVGAGPEAEAFAYAFWQKGRLYFLVKRR
jgi:membrane-bound lytic murein transglycosylase A